MSLETRKDKLIYGIAVPIIGAILGAIVATWIQASTIDKAQLADVVSLLKDPQLTAQQKIQALQMYREITDRPWGIIRSLTSMLTSAAMFAVGALVVGGYFRKDN